MDERLSKDFCKDLKWHIKNLENNPKSDKWETPDQDWLLLSSLYKVLEFYLEPEEYYKFVEKRRKKLKGTLGTSGTFNKDQ